MVRLTVACQGCRQSKLKCHHNGMAPCRRCERLGKAAGCVLSKPVVVSRQRAEPTAALGVRTISDGSGAITVTVPKEAVTEGVRWLARSYPELCFLQGLVGDVCDGVGWAVLALRAVDLGGGEVEEERARRWCEERWGEEGRAEGVMVGLLLGMRGWGMGRGGRAWMDVGNAVRRMQMLILRPPAEQTALLNRTYWACHLLERQVIFGTPQRPILPMPSFHPTPPSPTSDLLFSDLSVPLLQSSSSPPSVPSAVLPSSDLPSGPIDDPDSLHCLLTSGFAIWHDILTWVISGGRRQEHGPPWDDGGWKKLETRLGKWRGITGRRLRFPETGIERHVVAGTGEGFVYVNLVYYVSVLWLGREYMPFLPCRSSPPTGPLDPPLVPLTPPPNWWPTSFATTFHAARSITTLLTTISSLNTPLYTPFVGLCVFSAATMSLYIRYFPLMFETEIKAGVPISAIQQRAAGEWKAAARWMENFKRRQAIGEGWSETLARLDELYARVEEDEGRYRGMGREDFRGLESSVHDTGGGSPEEHEKVPYEARVPRKKEEGAVAAIDGIVIEDFAGDWSDIWSLMGEYPDVTL